jgi:hypothetical protein
MKIEAFEPLEIKSGDDGREVLIRVAPQLPVRIITLAFDGKKASSQQMNELARQLEHLGLREITVTTN